MFREGIGNYILTTTQKAILGQLCCATRRKLSPYIEISKDEQQVNSGTRGRQLRPLAEDRPRKRAAAPRNWRPGLQGQSVGRTESQISRGRCDYCRRPPSYESWNERDDFDSAVWNEDGERRDAVKTAGGHRVDWGSPFPAVQGLIRHWRNGRVHDCGGANLFGASYALSWEIHAELFWPANVFGKSNRY